MGRTGKKDAVVWRGPLQRCARYGVTRLVRVRRNGREVTIMETIEPPAGDPRPGAPGAPSDQMTVARPGPGDDESIEGADQ